MDSSHFDNPRGRLIEIAAHALQRSCNRDQASNMSIEEAENHVMAVFATLEGNGYRFSWSTGGPFSGAGYEIKPVTFSAAGGAGDFNGSGGTGGAGTQSPGTSWHAATTKKARHPGGQRASGR